MTLDLHRILSDEDFELAAMIVGARSKLMRPDLVIAPDGAPYLYRWHLIPRNDLANVYFHVQVGSDPERPPHDHPWDNTSVILRGGYDELWEPCPWMNNNYTLITRRLRAGDVCHRKASEAHRLILPKDIKYTMTIFSTGPAVRQWGFWTDSGWVDHKTMTKLLPDGRSVMREEYRGG